MKFHNGRVELWDGDCRDVLAGFEPDTFDACVTDPPYHFASIAKRWSGEGPPPVEGVYRRSTRGFMGKQWDGGQIAHDPATWAAVLRVLRPGAHLVAFHAPKNWHRLACAIEDAGFEIRDTLLWLFGSGFPKSHNVGKAIDRELGAEREVIGEYAVTREFKGRDYVGEASHSTRVNITAPGSPEAAAWEGWGTALKPAYEPIVLARKPLSEKSIAANVMRWGTGAINVDGCRISYENDAPSPASNPLYRKQNGYRSAGNDDSGSSSFSVKGGGAPSTAHASGRWPANVVHDGSPEVVAGFPESNAGTDNGQRGSGGIWQKSSGVPCGPQHGDSGSAARFFATFPRGDEWTTSNANAVHGASDSDVKRFHYTSKADADDRLGSKHPTVKPLDLMQWLVRLVTPPGGHVLDCFAGTGTTAEACLREGFRCTLIEREAEYLADIDRRMVHAFDGEVGRSVAMAKLKPEQGDVPLLDYIEAAE